MRIPSFTEGTAKGPVILPWQISAGSLRDHIVARTVKHVT